jgi:hypothetical protein
MPLPRIMGDVNPLQGRILLLASEFAGRFPYVKAVHVFGSVARGATDEAGDVDLFFEFADDFRPLAGTREVETHTRFHGDLRAWREWATQILGKPVKECCIDYGYPDKDIWDAIRAAPVIASCGKALLVPTAPVEKSRAAVRGGG